MAHILVVDDELAMRRSLRALLEGEGHKVRLARSADDAVDQLKLSRPDLILLDVMMPGRNGFSLCEELRSQDRLTPIIFLTAMGDEASRVRGLGLGADDYIDKTAGNAELLARVARALKRLDDFRSSIGPENTVRIGHLCADLESRCLLENGTQVGRLSATEADILRLLAKDRGKPVPINKFLASIRDEDSEIEPATLRSQISRLKSKLGQSGEQLVNRYGIGYTLLLN